jgi:hypothetical protein
MDGKLRRFSSCLLLLFMAAAGCRSPYRSDQGALFGGLLGAGTGAVVGHAVGNTGAGAVIGAGVGALSGAAVGSEMDDIEAHNRAMIEAKLGRQVAPGAVGIDEVVNMTRAGVDPDLIATHVRTHGMAAPLQSSDLIMLQQQGVNKQVIAAMQAPPPAQPAGAVVYPAPAPVIVEEYPYGPYYGPRVGYYYRAPPRHAGVSWGVTVRD